MPTYFNTPNPLQQAAEYGGQMGQQLGQAMYQVPMERAQMLMQLKQMQQAQLQAQNMAAYRQQLAQNQLQWHDQENSWHQQSLQEQKNRDTDNTTYRQMREQIEMLKAQSQQAREQLLELQQTSQPGKFEGGNWVPNALYRGPQTQPQQFQGLGQTLPPGSNLPIDLQGPPQAAAGFQAMQPSGPVTGPNPGMQTNGLPPGVVPRNTLNPPQVRTPGLTPDALARLTGSLGNQYLGSQMTTNPAVQAFGQTNTLPYYLKLQQQLQQQMQGQQGMAPQAPKVPTFNPTTGQLE